MSDATRVDPVVEARFAKMFKAYDVRGVVPTDWDEVDARAIGTAFARFCGTSGVVVGRDMRTSGEAFAAAFADGVRGEGVDVVDIGLASTDLLYFASGTLDLPGAQFTASHNPAEYNGIKMCLAGAAPLAYDTGLETIRDLAVAVRSGAVPVGSGAGTLTSRSFLDAFADHCIGFLGEGGPSSIRKLKVVADTANGMGGLVVPAVLGRLPIDLDDPLRRTGRHLPEPSRRPDPAREPA